MCNTGEKILLGFIFVQKTAWAKLFNLELIAIQKKYKAVDKGGKIEA